MLNNNDFFFCKCLISIKNISSHLNKQTWKVIRYILLKSGYLNSVFNCDLRIAFVT